MAFPTCGYHVSWWDGEYEGNYELRDGHPEDIHWDGMSWYNDDRIEIDLDETDLWYILSVYGNPNDRRRLGRERNRSIRWRW